MICPFYKNKEVFNGFNEIVEALGGKPLTEDEFKSAELRNLRSGLDFAAMEAAYTLYHRNNGNFLDLAPNGERSVLFDTYLLLFNNDRTKAILKKAEVYSDNFINWFGDWLNDPANASKVVDYNGEPLIVYHGGALNIRIFRHSDNNNSNTGSGYYTDERTGEKILFDSNNAIFFSSNRFVGTSYATLYGIHYFLKLRFRIRDILIKSNKNGMRFSKETFKKGIDDIYELFDSASEFNPRFKSLKEYVKKLKDLGKNITKSNEIEAVTKMLKDLYSKVYEYSDSWIMNRSEWEYVYDRAIKLIDEYNNPEGIQRLIAGEIPETIKNEWELYKKIESYRDKEGKEQIANYEELNMTLGERRYYLNYDGHELSLWTPDYKDPKISDMTEKLLSDFFNEAKYSAEYGILTLKDDTIYQKVKSKSQEYPLFLNMKNPLSHDYEGTHLGEGYKESNKYPFGYVAARLVRKAINDGYDGVIYENIYDPYLANNYGVLNPNLVKSAIGNNGNYSTESDNQYENRELSEIIDILKELSEFRYEDDAKNNHSYLHRFHSKWYLTKFSPNSELLFKNLLISQKLPQDLFTLKKYPHSTLVSFDESKLLDYIEMNRNNANFGDMFEREEEASAVRDILDFLSAKTGMAYQTISYKDALKIAPKLIDSSTNAFVKDNTVYFIEGKKLNVDIASEEMLHPFIKALALENPKLFLNLVNECKRLFPKLRLLIAKSYKKYHDLGDKDKLRQMNHEELVTQSLARAFREERKNNPKGRKLSEIINLFLDFVRNLFSVGKRKISANEININTSLFDLAKIINSELDLLYKDSYSNIIRLNQEVEESSTENVRPNGTSFSRLIETYDNIENSRQLFIQLNIQMFKQTHQDDMSDDLLNIRSADIARQSRKQFNENRITDLLLKQLLDLVRIFGASYSEGIYTFASQSSENLLKERIINSLNENTWNSYVNIKHGDINLKLNEKLSPVNVIYLSMYDGDLTTFNKQIIRDYISLFFNSELIQAGLKAISKEDITLEERISLLADAISQRTLDIVSNKRLLAYIDSFWDDLNNISSTIISENDVTELQKELILKNITDAILIKEDMFYSEMDQPLYDAFTGNFDSSTFLSKEDKDIFLSIRSGTITRLKSVLSRYLKNTTLIEKLKARVEILETTDEDSAQQIFDTIEDFLITANDELLKTMGYINIDLKSKPIYEWSPLEINFINQDLIGYYEPLIRDISMLFADKSSAIYTINKQRIEREGGLSLANTANLLRSYVDELKSTYQKDVVMKWSKWYINDQIDKDENITNKALFKENAHRWLELDMTTGDLATGEVLIGMASRSKSSIIKIADWVSFLAEQEIHRKTLNKGIELVNLYNKIRPFGSQISPLNFFNKFVEKDKKGMPTGYFIRKHNYGQYYQDKDEFEQSLREKYNLGVDENGNTIFPENEDSKADNSTYNQYMDELDEWTDSRIHRRYKLSYYKKRRRILSAKSILASDQILRQIDILEQKASVDWWFDSTKLTKNEINQLKKYRQEKEDLSNFYTYITTSNGRIIIEEKTGDALQIARELSEWKNIRSKYIKYTPNWDKFNQAKQELVNRYGADSKEVIDFEKNNTSKRISQDFWYKFFIHNDPNYSKLEIEYRKRYRDLLQMSKDKYGYYLPHLIKFGEGLNGEDVSVWRELKRVELKIQQLRNQRIALLGNSGVVKTGLDLYDFVTDAFVNIPGTSKSFYTHLKEKWLRAIDEDPVMALKFNELFTYLDSKGRTKILKAFKYIRPNKKTFNIAGEQVDTIEIVPSIYFSEVDKTSTWVNEDYDLNSSDELQFKNEEYINKDFDNITGDLKTFYDKMLDIMDEANSLIPKKALSRRYLLPLISGRKMQVFGRLLKHLELFQGMKYCMLDLFGFTYAESTAEASTNTDLPRRPDGSIVNNIPVRFLNKLENPSVISTDLISSIILYYEMAVNYSEKSKVLPSLELINQAIRPKSEYVGLPQQSKKLENMLDIRFYGHESTYGSAGKKLSKTNQRTILSAKTLKKWAAVGMLGMNFTAAEVGHLDAIFVAIGDAFGLKYITKRDLLVGYGLMWAHVPKMLSGLGKQSVNDKMVALMQLNNLSKSNSEIFEFSDMSRASKFLKLHLLMGGFTLGDYMINTMLIGAVYNNYRLLTDPTTGKERFMSLEEFIISSENIGLTEKEAKRIYYKSKTHLFDAYTVENGLAKVKPEYVHAVTKKVQNTVAGLLKDRSSVYNGLLPDTEKAKLQQNVFGSYVTLMRRFMINQYWEKFNTQVDYVAKDDSEVSWTSAYTRDDIYGHNFRTGVEQGAVFKDFIRGMCKYGKNLLFFYRHTEAEKLTRNQRYAVKRTLAEWACLALICYAMINSILFARKKDYDDDKKPVWTINLIDPVGLDRDFLEFDFDNWDKKFFNHLRWKSALLTTRLFTERAGSFWPGTIMELLTSPTTVYSYITDVGRTLDLCADFLGINGHSNDEMIKTGAYKNMSRGTRDILKMFKANGVDNLVRNWHTDGVKSVLNYYSKITPTEWFIPAKESKSSKESTNTVSTNTHYNVD